MCEPEIVRHAELGRPVGEEELFRAGGLERFASLVERQVTAGLTVGVSVEECRLAEEEIRSMRRLDEGLGRTRVARVREDPTVLHDPQRMRLDVVMGHTGRSDGTAACA